MQTSAVIRGGAAAKGGEHASAPVDMIYVVADLLMGGAQMGLLRLVDLGIVCPLQTQLLVLGRSDAAIWRAVAERGPWAGVTLCDRGPAPRRWFEGMVVLARLLRRHRPRLVVLSLEPANLVGRLLRPFFRQSLFCSFEHSERYRRWLYRALFPLLAPAIDVVLYDCAASRAGVARFYDSRPRIWIEMPLYVFDPDVPAKKDYALGPVVRILSVGRLQPAKDQELLLRVVAELRGRGLAVTCEIVGEGPLRQKLERLAAALQLAPYVSLSGQDPGWLKRAWQFDLYLQTSEHEGACLTVLEAMSAGLPIVATAVGEIPVHLGRGAGIALNTRDPAAIADVLEALLRDEAARRNLGQAARNRVQAQYARELVREQMRRRMIESLGPKLPLGLGRLGA